MIDKTKRKNDLAVPEYDEMWLFRLYRQLNWHKTQTMRVDASPETCLVHIKRLEDRTTYDYTVKTQEEIYPYQFQVTVMTVSRLSNYNYTPMATIVGTILKDEEDSTKSIIVFRAYPGGIFNRVLITAFLVWVLRMIGASSIDPFGVAVAILATVSLILLWHAFVANRNEGLDLVASHFLSYLPLSEKTKTGTHALVEAELYEQQTQKR